MTQEEINKFLADTKVYVNGKSKEIQEKLFSLGYCWHISESTKVTYEDDPFLYINKNYTISSGCNMCNFARHPHHEISAEEILSLELTESAYRPFKSKEECWNEMLGHQPFGWTKNKEKHYYINLILVDNNRIDSSSFRDMYEDYTFADGTPFGIKKD